MAMMTFVNLPVKDLEKATDFFSEIGFAFDRSSRTRPRHG
jgi:predicted lactoylglutathione lyase